MDSDRFDLVFYSAIMLPCSCSLSFTLSQNSSDWLHLTKGFEPQVSQPAVVTVRGMCPRWHFNNILPLGHHADPIEEKLSESECAEQSEA